LTTASPIAPPANDHWRAIGTGFAIIVGALAITGVLLLASGVNPLLAYWEILRGAFKSVGTIAETLLYATPVILTALSVILCFRCGLWNIGADGQLYLGAIAAVAVGFNALNLPGPLVLPAMFIAAFVAGGFWAFIPAVLRLWAGASEVIVTIMMNFIAIILATYLIGGPWASGITPATGPIVSAGFLPILIPGTRLHANIIVAIIAAVSLSIILKYTVFGYRVRTVGQNAQAARYAGIPVNRVMLASFVGGGALAGLAGFGEVAGVYHDLPDSLSPGFGYTGIVVALLARLNPIWAVVVAYLLAALTVGAGGMQRAIGVPVSLVTIMESILILIVLATGILDRNR
jgi:general nucleoside transport system permease protein